MGAVVRQRLGLLAPPAPGERWLAIASIDSPGNLGTMLRTAEAAGLSGVILLGPPFADPWDPAAVRASMGALFAQRIVRAALPELAAWARGHRVGLLGSSPRGLLTYRDTPVHGPAALLIGSEKTGLSEHALELCHQTVRIPMAGRGDSLNAAVAAGILLYGLFAQSR